MNQRASNNADAPNAALAGRSSISEPQVPRVVELRAATYAAADRLYQAVFDAFTQRRYERVKTVVDSSVQLGQWMLDDVDGNVPALMGRVFGLVSQPA